jgi:DNA-directed RNA polymerase specialized sigma24 family protein
VIALRFGNDFSLKETARVMGKNVNAIKALQFRALNALREKLGEEEL